MLFAPWVDPRVRCRSLLFLGSISAHLRNLWLKSVVRVFRVFRGNTSAPQEMKISPASRVVMIGDSITDCGRVRNTTEGDPAGLGIGYVAIANALLSVEMPERKILVINRGVSGDTVRDLKARWDRDVIALRPDWVTVMIGVNDVWRLFDPDPAKHADAVPAEEYEPTYDALLARTRPHIRGLALLSPFVVHPDRNDPMRKRVEVFAAVVRELAARHDAVFVDTQAAYDRMLGELDFALLAPDCVHPTILGHTVLAQALLAALR